MTSVFYFIIKYTVSINFMYHLYFHDEKCKSKGQMNVALLFEKIQHTNYYLISHVQSVRKLHIFLFAVYNTYLCVYIYYINLQIISKISVKVRKGSGDRGRNLYTKDNFCKEKKKAIYQVYFGLVMHISFFCL